MPKHIRTNRRDFLRSTTLAAAAPFILPSHVWSAAVKPNSRITLGFIGIGTQGRGLMGGFLGKKETQTVAVCDVDTTRRQSAKKTVDDHYAKENNANYQGCTAYTDFRDLLERKDIDAVVIATPDHWHTCIGIAAARAKKDIYCEKPLTESIFEARSYVDAIRKNKRVFQTGSMQRSSREFRVACELVRNGIIGKVKNIDVMVGGPGVPCDLPAEEMEPGLDWDMWLGPAPSRPYHSKLSPRGVHKHFPGWRDYREYGGGMVTDWGAHHYDIAQWAMGKDDSGPVEVIATSDPTAKHGVIYKYEDGVEVLHKDGNGVWIYGTDGKIYVNRGKFELWLGGEQKVKDTKTLDAVENQYLSNAKVKLYKSSDHKSDFLSCIKTRKRPICDIEVGARTVTVCHLVNLAYYHHKSFKWDPKKNQFADKTGDPKWLDVPHRDPWKIV